MINFTIIKNDLLNYELSDGAFKLYFVLKSYCFGKKTNCFPSQETLASKMGKSVKTVQRKLKELISTGLISVKRRGSISNVYILHEESNSENEINYNEDTSKKTETIDKSNTKTTYANKSVNSDVEKELLTAINSYKHTQKNTYVKNKGYFCDYPQREYDFDSLEKKLLGQLT